MNRLLRGVWALAVALPLALTACSDEEKKCEDFCGEGSACVGGSCVAYEPCAAACDAGFACQDGGCVPTLASACGGACAGADQICLTSGGAAECVTVCGAGQAWNSASNTCEATAAYCGSGQTWDPVALKCTLTNLHAAYLDKDFANGPAVTAECIKCHEVEATQMLGTAHFKWAGDAVTGETNVGKKNMVNNFCVAVPSNEARCVQCHPGYGSAPVKDDAGNVTSGGAAYRAPAIGNVDCLICHANLGTSGYGKSGNNWGAASLKNKGTCFPSCKANEFCDSDNTCKVPTAAQITATLRAAAMSVGRPSRSNCGYCHFNAGGGDNVKMGDLGSALANPADTVDVHMGRGIVCADCHAGSSHQLLGTGISIPVLEGGRVTCSSASCHPNHDHGTTALENTTDSHMAWVACQTCHIPTFSQTQFTKTNWDWKSAGDKGACQGVTGCVPLDPATGRGGETPKTDVGGGKHVAYDWKKGISTYEQNVLPVYFWFDGTATHATAGAGGFDPLAVGMDAAHPARVNAPLGAPASDGSSKIYPFKRMTGTQPAFVDGSRFIVPHVFGTDGLWTNLASGAPTVPVFEADGTTRWAWDQARMDGIWAMVVNYGGGVAGQIPVVAKVSKNLLVRAADVVTATTQAPLAGGVAVGDQVFLVSTDPAFKTGLKTIASIDGGRTSFTYAEAGADGTVNAAVVFYGKLPAWTWAYTEMFMNLNHEVRPAAQALGCGACHAGGGTPSVLRGLYGCDDPMSCPQKP